MADRVLKLEASAGSGKTYLLAREFLACLLQTMPRKRISTSEELEGLRRRIGTILAITFTNKAAGEMKDRILSALKDFALAGRGKELAGSSRILLGELKDSSKLAEVEILSRSALLLDAIFSGYDDFHVRTIDSLMNNIITVISPDLNLPADYCVTVDPTAAMDQALYDFLAHQAEAEWPSVEAFLRDYASLQALKSWNIHEEIASSISRLYTLSLHRQTAIADEPGGSGGDSRSELDKACSRLARALKSLVTLMEEEPLKDFRSAYLNGTRISAKRFRSLRDFVADARVRGMDGLHWLASSPPEAFLNKTCPESYRHRFVSTLQPAIALLGEAYVRLSQHRVLRLADFYSRFVLRWTSGRRTLYVGEFSRTIRDRIREWEKSAPPYLYLKLADRYLHFLFDEFQDTSELQFLALAPIVDEVYSSIQEATLFLVGDRKQAIYRWRGGNSQLMDREMLQARIPNLAHEPESAFNRTKTENWRSGEEIVAFNNAFWNPEALGSSIRDEPLHRAVADNFAAAVQTIPPSRLGRPGYVRIELDLHADGGEESAEEKEAESARPLDDLFSRILGHIKTCTGRGYDPSDIAVLLRRNEECRRLLAFLGEAGVNAVSDESLQIAVNPLAQEVIAFFRFLDYPPDNVSFIGFVGGDIFRARAAAVCPEESSRLDERLFVGIGGRPAYPLFRERFPVLWKSLIEPFFKAVGFLAPYDMFADFTMRFRLFENFPGNASFMISFADLLHRLEQEGVQSITAFLAKWDLSAQNGRGYEVASLENRSAVRIMTLHQAKGLGFPVVIMPLMPIRLRTGENLFQHEDRLYWINREFRKASPFLEGIARKGLEADIIDELNLLYVGMTRAEAALFVCGWGVGGFEGMEGPKAVTSSASLFFCHPLFASQSGSRIFCEKGTLAEKPGTEEKRADRENSPAAVIGSKRLATTEWQREYIVFTQATAFTAEERAAARRGETFHRLLARLERYESPAELRRAVATLGREEGWEEADAIRLADFLCRPQAFRFFSGTAEVHTEKEWCCFSSGRAETRRVDRLLVGDEIEVVEFKTGKSKEPGHGDQVREYMQGLKALFPGKPIRGHLHYVELGETEEILC